MIRRHDSDESFRILRDHVGQRQEYSGPGVATPRLFDDPTRHIERTRFFHEPAVVAIDDGHDARGRDDAPRPVERMLEHRTPAGERAVLLRPRVSQPAPDEGLHALPVSPGQNDDPSFSGTARHAHFLLDKAEIILYPRTAGGHGGNVTFYRCIYDASSGNRVAASKIGRSTSVGALMRSDKPRRSRDAHPADAACSNRHDPGCMRNSNGTPFH